MSPAEQSLLQRWTDHRDAEAFAELVKRYAGLVYGTCRRILRNDSEAEDVAQECFLKLAQSRRLSIGSLGGWLHTVATREALNRIKAEQRRAARETAYAQEHSQQAEIQWDDLQEWVDEALEALREELRDPVIRHFLQGETHDAIARDLGLSRSTVTRHIARGIEDIRAFLRKRGLAVPAAVLSATMAAEMVEAAPVSLRAALGRYALAGAERVNGAGARVSPSMRGLNRPWVATGLVAVAAMLLVVWGVSSWRASGPEGGGERPRTMATVEPAGEPAMPPSELEAMEPGAREIAQAVAPEVQATPPQVAAAMGDTETVSLRCLDPGGKAVAGAEVYFIHIENFSGAMTYPKDSSDRRMKTVGPVVSGEDGWVHVDGIPRFTTRFGGRNAYARVPGGLAGIWQGSATKRPGVEPTQDIRLAPVMEVHGTVEVAADVDAASVAVEVLSLYRRGIGDIGTMFTLDYVGGTSLWPEVFRTSSDATGAFVIPDMPEDTTVYLSANGPGLANTQFMGSNLTGQTITMSMEPEGIVEGVVVREGSKDPAPGVSILVQAEQANGILVPHIERADSQGGYRVAGLPPGRHHARVLVGNQPSKVNACPVFFDVVSGKAIQAADLVVERGALVSGTVRDAQAGTPIPGATLVALYPAEVGGTAVASAKAGKDGVYSMRLPVGEHMFYLFDATEAYAYPEDQAKRVVVVPPMQQSVLGVDFELRRTGTDTPVFDSAKVEGLVIDEAGTAVEGVSVTDYEKMERGPGWRTVAMGQSGVDGRFSFEIRAGSEHEIGVGGGAFTSDRSDAFTPGAGETYDVGSFVVQRLYGVFTGTVVDEKGAPMANAELYMSSRNVSWSSGNVTTDANGRFTVDPAPEDDVMYVHIRKPGYGNGYYQDFQDVPSGEDRVYVLKREE